MATLVAKATTIVLRINGRDCNLTHTRTDSFKFLDADRPYWYGLDGQQVTLDVISIDGQMVGAGTAGPQIPLLPVPLTAPPPAPRPLPARRAGGGRQPAACFAPAGWKQPQRHVLCIGLDLAWFGGSRGDRNSQYDCLTYLVLDNDNDNDNDKGISSFGLKRVALGRKLTEKGNPYANCDPAAELLLEAIDSLVKLWPDHACVLAIDAPLQASSPPHPPRHIKQKKGDCRHRACETLLQAACGLHARRWMPMIQPGAPLTQRVIALMAGLGQNGFTVFPKESKKLVIECFPREAQWSAAVRNGYGELTPLESRLYKTCGNDLLPIHLYTRFAVDALVGLGLVSGIGRGYWNQIICELLKSLSGDALWITQKTGYGRGGKLFDDAVDATIALSVAVAFACDQAHVWIDGNGADGHIIGPGQ
ncbi:MAG: hypothetical protein WCJ97_11445 [Phycisphaerae bacterium]